MICMNEKGISIDGIIHTKDGLLSHERTMLKDWKKGTILKRIVDKNIPRILSIANAYENRDAKIKSRDAISSHESIDKRIYKTSHVRKMTCVVYV